MRSRVLAAAMLASSFIAAGCGVSGEGVSRAVTPTTGRQLIVAIDLSGSRSVDAMEADRQMLNIIAASLDYGDEVVLMRIPEASGRDPLTTTRRVPPRRNSSQHTVADDRQRAAIREDVAHDIKKMLVPSENRRHSETDIIGALFAASDRARENGGRHTALVLLSDMVQEGRGLNFTRSLPSKDWLEAPKRVAPVPALTGVCVTAVGPDVSTPAAIKIRDFWAGYFNASGALFSSNRYRRTMTEFNSVLCSPTTTIPTQ